MVAMMFYAASFIFLVSFQPTNISKKTLAINQNKEKLDC